MDSPPPLNRLTDELARGCPICEDGPTDVVVLGPNEIVLNRCGHVIDAEEWAAKRYLAAEVREQARRN